MSDTHKEIFILYMKFLCRNIYSYYLTFRIDQLAGRELQESYCLLLPSTGVLHGCWELDSDLHVCIASTVFPKLSPQPHTHFWCHQCLGFQYEVVETFLLLCTPFTDTAQSVMSRATLFTVCKPLVLCTQELRDVRELLQKQMSKTQDARVSGQVALGRHHLLSGLSV